MTFIILPDNGCGCGSGRRDFIRKTALFSTGTLFLNPVLMVILKVS